MKRAIALLGVSFGAYGFLTSRRPVEVLFEFDRAARQKNYVAKRALIADPLQFNDRMENLTDTMVETDYPHGVPSGRFRVLLDPKAPFSRYVYGPSGMLRVGFTASGWKIDGMWATPCQAHPMEDYILRTGIELFQVDTPVK